VSDCEELVGVT